MIVIAKGVGRLANRLLLFSHFIGAAAEHGLTVINPAFHLYARHFPSTAHDLLCRFPAGKRLPVLPGSGRVFYSATACTAEVLYLLQQLGFDAPLIRLRRDQRLDLNSDTFLRAVRGHRMLFVQDWFFRNADNCERHRDVIRSFFRPWEHHLERAAAVVEPARTRRRLVVGVHIRRGDYETFKGGRFFYSHAQYRALMEAIEPVFPTEDVTYLVCSDSPIPPDAFDGLDVLYGNGHPVEDLYALAGCDRIIGPPSTYTTWASFYGDVPLYVIRDAEALPDGTGFQVSSGLGWGRADLASWGEPRTT